MFGAAMGPHPSLGAVVIGLLVIALIARRNLRARPLRVERMWLRPVVFAIIVYATVGATPLPYDPMSLGLFGLSLVLGAGLGWQRGRLITISVDPDTHALTSKASPIGMVFILVILAVRVLLRGALMENRMILGVSGAAVTDALVFALGAMMIAQSLEMWLRARALLEAARAVKLAAKPAASENPQPPLIS